MQLFSMDLKTMAFIAMSLTFILSLFMALVRQGAKYVQGPNYWALGSLSICFGMAVLFFGFGSVQWMMVPGPMFIVIGIGLFINGLQAFNGQAPDRWIPALLALLLGGVDWFFIVVQPDLRIVVTFNAILFATAYSTAGRMLLRSVSQDLKLIYRLNAGLFFLIAMFMVYRAYAAFTAPPAMFLGTSEWIVNQLTFLAFFVHQLCVTFSLTLMLLYRNMQTLRDMSSCDELTGALNRRGLEEAATAVQSNSNRNFEVMSLLLIDIDGMHTINASCGEKLGDELLREFSQVIHASIRTGDFFGRYGSDEFCVVLFNITEQHSLELAERIRSSLELRLVEHEDQNTYATASIGVSNSKFVGLNYQELLAAAQSAMYNAKELGRNRVVAHSSIHAIV